MWGRLLTFANPFMLYIKLALVAAVVGVAVWGTWEVRSGMAVKEKAKAVSDAVKQIEKDLEEERRLRAHFQGMADDKLATLLQLISNIKSTHTEIVREVQVERKSNPAFYQQPLPPKGYEQWKRARALVQSSAASSSAP